MRELFAQLGISLSALSAQAINFLVVLVVLTIFVYRPLLRIVEERRRRIEGGLEKERQAEKKLAEIDSLRAERMKQAEAEAFGVVNQATRDAEQVKEKILSEGQEKSDYIIQEARSAADRIKIEGLVGLENSAIDLVKSILVKAVKLEPKHIDDALIKKAGALVKEEKL